VPMFQSLTRPNPIGVRTILSHSERTLLPIRQINLLFWRW